MAQLVVTGAMMQCTFGAAPSTLNATSAPTTTCGAAAATIMDNKPMSNIPPFGACTSASNPQVAAAQGAPQPCVPVIASPWTPGSPTVSIGGNPALNSTSKCTCNWGGVISITQPGQTTTNVA